MEHGTNTNVRERQEAGAFGRVKVIFTVFAGIVFFTTVLIAVAQIRNSYDALVDSEQRESRNIARSGRSHATQIFNEARRILEGIANIYVDRGQYAEFNEAFFHQLLSTSIDSSSYLDALYLLDSGGFTLASGQRFPLEQTSKTFSVIGPMGISVDRSDFHLLRFDRASESSGEHLGGRWLIPVVLPIQGVAGQRQGYLVGLIDPDVFRTFYSNLEVGQYGQVLLWDSRGTLIAGNQNAQWKTGDQVPSVADRMTNASAQNVEDYATTYVTQSNGNTSVTSLLDMREFGLWLSVNLDGRDFLAAWRQNRIQIIIEAVLFLLFLAALSLILLRQLRRIELSEHKLVAAKNEAERANDIKVQFLAQVSHEFRTPLNAIIGFSQAIRDRVFGSQPNDKYTEYADDIYNSGRHLLELVNDIIDFSRIEAGEYRVKKTQINTKECLDKIIAMLSGLAQDKDIAIKPNYPDHPVFLHADERLLKQVVINLLSNAIKFSDSGSVVHLSYTANASGGLDIIISDEGPGIHASIIERLGQPFLVESSQTNTQGQGSGLGLSIAKTCMELMGGTLRVTSEPHRGATVTLSFPT